MYIRKSIRSYRGRTYINYVLVESVHTPKGPRQKTICSLGDLRPRPREAWIEFARKIEDALVGQSHLLDTDDSEVADIVHRVRARRRNEQRRGGERPPPPPALPAGSGALIKVDPTRVATERHREAGPVHVGHQFWHRLELDRILRDCGLSATVLRLACAMVLNRLIAPASEHAMPAWLRRTALGDLFGTDFDTLEEDPLYKVLDQLHPHRAAIEAALVARERSLFNLDVTIYLYDLTSTYFEGQCARNPKAKRGYSRDHRPDCKQVVVALVINRDGFAITHEVFAGNTQDRATLATMLDLLTARAGLKEGATVVVDRGMAFDENIAGIKRRKLHYVVACRQPERDRWLAEFDDTDGFIAVLRQPSPLNPGQKKTMIEVKIRRDGDQTYVLCRSEQRIPKDRAIRTRQEVRLRADIDRLAKRIAQRRLVKPAKINQAIGRLKERYPRGARDFGGAVQCRQTRQGRAARRLLSDQDRPHRPLRRRTVAHLRPAHPCRERLPRHEIAARRTADLSSHRAPHRSAYLPVRARLPSADRNREDAPRPRHPHLLADGARHPQGVRPECNV